MSSPSRAVLVAATLVVVAVLATACGSTPSSSGGSASTGPTAAQPTASPTPSPEATPTPPVAGAIPADARGRAQVRASIEDAARRQGVAPDDVDIAAFTPVTWNDGSLGCPREDMSYTMATVEGELLVLRVETALLQYHGRVGGPYTFCPAPSAGYSVGG